MSEKIVVPVLGESITEATVAKWLKNVGDNIEADEPIVELETDKVNLEVPSPIDGILSEINANNGQVVEVGAVLGLIANGKIETKKKEATKEKQTIKKPEKITKSDPELFDNNVVKLEKKPVSEKIEEEPLVLSKEIGTTAKTTNKELNQTLSPAVRKIVEEKSRYSRIGSI